MVKLSLSSLRAVMPTSLRRLVRLSEGVNFVFETLRNIATFLAALGSTSLALLGTSLSTGAIRLPSVQIDQAAFPIRFVLFVVVAAGLGWALGALAGLTSRLPRDVQPVLAGLLAVLFAGLMAGTADWLVGGQGGSGTTPQTLAMTLIGAAVTCRLCAWQFETGRSARSPQQMLDRARVLLTFTIAVALLVLLVELGVT